MYIVAGVIITCQTTGIFVILPSASMLVMNSSSSSKISSVISIPAFLLKMLPGSAWCDMPSGNI